MNKNVLLFGGAFDPPHNGHARVALAALNMVWEECHTKFDLWFLPCFSDTFGQKKMESPEDRIAMLNILVDDMKDERLSVCTFEIEMANSAGTYAVVQALRKAYPGFNFRYVIGRDQAKNIRLWRNSRDLVKTIPFVVMARAGTYGGGGLWFSEKPHIYSLKSDPPDRISSTNIREHFRTHRSVLSGARRHSNLNQRVFQYIMDNNLYRGTADEHGS